MSCLAGRSVLRRRIPPHPVHLVSVGGAAVARDPGGPGPGRRPRLPPAAFGGGLEPRGRFQETRQAGSAGEAAEAVGPPGPQATATSRAAQGRAGGGGRARQDSERRPRTWHHGAWGCGCRCLPRPHLLSRPGPCHTHPCGGQLACHSLWISPPTVGG